MISNKWFVTILIPIGLVLIGLLVVRFPVSVAQAGPNLPNRSTPTPANDDDDDDDDDRDSGPIGAYIELQVAGPPAGAWTVVQWQDTTGGWHNVEGWQGALDTKSGTRWWVAEKDFRTGPFRWVVTQGKSGSVVGASQMFNLPGGANEMVQITVSVAE
jgi:hypothetical protein